jgi:carbon-monoxide dehydrogenase medium subunit
MRVPDAESFLVGRSMTEDVIEDAANRAAEAARPISDTRGSADYRRELVRVLTRRTLARTLSRINCTGQEGME